LFRVGLYQYFDAQIYTMQETELNLIQRVSRRQTGFTLIELVVVVSVIAILSAIALPRYINMQTQARVAKAQAIFGSIKSAAALGRASCMMDVAGLVAPSTCTATAGTTSMDGAAVSMVNQYPAATTDGIVLAAQLDPVSDQVVVTAGNPILIDIVGGTSPNCQIRYTAATAGPTAPAIQLVTSGC
jgi:MSHA pilin protein MshA